MTVLERISFNASWLFVPDPQRRIKCIQQDADAINWEVEMADPFHQVLADLVVVLEPVHSQVLVPVGPQRAFSPLFSPREAYARFEGGTGRISGVPEPASPARISPSSCIVRLTSDENLF